METVQVSQWYMLESKENWFWKDKQSLSSHGDRILTANINKYDQFHFLLVSHISWNTFPYSLLNTAFQQYHAYPPQLSSDHCLCHHSKITFTFLLLHLCHKFCFQCLFDSWWCCTYPSPFSKNLFFSTLAHLFCFSVSHWLLVSLWTTSASLTCSASGILLSSHSLCLGLPTMPPSTSSFSSLHWIRTLST